MNELSCYVFDKMNNKNYGLIMKKSFYYRNGLSIFFLSIFILALWGQAYFGWKEFNEQLVEFGAREISLLDYFSSGHFISSTFENFQSEFLQMSLYVILTISLRQVGSAESKDLEKLEEVDREPNPNRKGAPMPVKKGGWRLFIYQRSLSIAFVLLFFFSWIAHLYGSFNEYNLENVLKKQSTVSLIQFLKEPKFWFESFQNWQSEFISVASIIILSIFLRQKGSPESKPVDASHSETGK